jgi:hypothetical protein
MISGFDRLLFRGTIRMLATAKGLMGYLWAMQIRLTDFGDWSQQLTERLKQESLQMAQEAGRPVVYLNDNSIRKEDLARSIAKRDGIEQGLVCVLSAVEPCWSYDLHRNRAEKKLQLVARLRKCLHQYHYRIHPQLGLMHARVQTWLPFNVKVCLNGREWLGRQMDEAGIDYVKKDNCFTRISDLPGAQLLLDDQLTTSWPEVLESVRRLAHPAHEGMFAANPLDYYWSVDQSEWATDVMFKSPAQLAGLYPRLIHQGIQTLGSRDVLRFLGKQVPEHRNARKGFIGEVLSDLKDRPEGMRLKHTVNGNSVKMYDKQGSVLRVETTLNNPKDFRVFRGSQTEPDKKRWRPLRKGVADLHRRAQVSQASNDRYLKAMAAVEQTTPLKDLAQPICQAVKTKAARARALNPMSLEDASLLETVTRGEFMINGFRNRDIRTLLYGKQPADKKQAKRISAKVGRKLRLLRAHGLIKKVPKTHRYQLTDKGRLTITALLAARSADATTLAKAA